MIFENVKAALGAKLFQYVTSIFAGFIVAFETSINFLVPCLIAVILDVVSAWDLGRRVHKKYPTRADGKFKSEYKYRIIATLIIIFLCIIMASYVDIYIIKNSDVSVRFVVAVFLFYQLWSCLENWSSENDNKIAKALQRVMVNKIERHINVPLADILIPDDKKATEESDDNAKGGNDGKG